MTNSQKFQAQIIPMLNQLGIFWMLLSKPRRSKKEIESLIISDIHPGFSRLLSLKKSQLINKSVESLRVNPEKGITKNFISNITNPLRKKFNLVITNQNYLVKKHSVLGNILITVQIKTKIENASGYPHIEKKFRSIFNALGDFVFINAFNGKFLEVNDTALKILAYSRTEFLKLTPREVSASKSTNSSELPASAFDQYDEWAQSEQLLFGAELLTKKGTRIPIEARSKIINYDGRDAILTIARDITERAMFEKRLLNIVMETEEKERRRLSEELHDGLGPLLSSVKMHTDMLINGDLDLIKKDEVARVIKELVSESINNIREISTNLMPHVLSNYGLVSALKILISKITVLQPINVKFEHSAWNIRPEISTEVLIYRVISELLTNTLKHASASSISISLKPNSGILEIVYKDDGIGFDSRQKLNQQTGMGLNNILNRIKSQQGSVNLKTSPGKGLMVQIQLPFES